MSLSARHDNMDGPMTVETSVAGRWKVSGRPVEGDGRPLKVRQWQGAWTVVEGSRAAHAVSRCGAQRAEVRGGVRQRHAHSRHQLGQLGRRCDGGWPTALATVALASGRRALVCAARLDLLWPVRLLGRLEKQSEALRSTQKQSQSISPAPPPRGRQPRNL